MRQNNSADEQAFIEHWRNIADKIHITELHNWAGTLNHESDVNYPCYRPWLTFTVLWDGRVSLCCADFDGKTDPGRPQHADDPGNLERRALPRRPPRAPRERRARRLPRLRSAAQRLASLDHQASVANERSSEPPERSAPNGRERERVGESAERSPRKADELDPPS